MSKKLNPSPAVWTVTAWALFHQGDRGNQEDRHDLRVQSGKMRFAIVTDGAGGPPAGEDAAEIGIKVIGGGCRANELAPGTPPTVVQQVMEGLFDTADKEVKSEGTTYPQKQGLGAACVFMLEVPPDFYFLNAGDARGYAYDAKSETLSMMTTDHPGPIPNSIRSALGWLNDKSLQTQAVDQVFTGDWGVILLCSDGLTKLVTDAEITEILKQGGTAQEICERLMAKANSSTRRRDNITIIVLLYRRLSI